MSVWVGKEGTEIGSMMKVSMFLFVVSSIKNYVELNKACISH